MYQRIYVQHKSNGLMRESSVSYCDFKTKEAWEEYTLPAQYEPYVTEVAEDLNTFKLSRMLLATLHQSVRDPDSYAEEEEPKTEFSLHDITWETGVTGEQLTDCMHLLVKYKFMIQKSAETYMLV